MIRKGLYAILTLVGLGMGLDYIERQATKDVLKPSEIRPTEVNLDSRVYPIASSELRFITTDYLYKCDIIFVDKEYNGSLDEVIIATAKDERDTLDTKSPHFAEWNQKFLEMRKRRFGGN